jgi:hypothetical protein
MQTLRCARQLTRLVLVWFVLAVGVAVAAPFIAPQSLQMVCTDAKSMRLVVKTADGNEAGAHTLHCPQCLVQLASAPPPSAPQHSALAAHPLAYASQPVSAAHIAWATRAPMPARGPPPQV